MEGETRGQKCHGGQKSSLQCAIEVEKLLIYFKICTKMIDKSCRILKVLAGKKMKIFSYSTFLLLVESVAKEGSPKNRGFLMKTQLFRGCNSAI